MKMCDGDLDNDYIFNDKIFEVARRRGVYLVCLRMEKDV